MAQPRDRTRQVSGGKGPPRCVIITTRSDSIRHVVLTRDMPGTRWLGADMDDDVAPTEEALVAMKTLVLDRAITTLTTASPASRDAVSCSG